MNSIPYPYLIGLSPPEFALLPVRLATTCGENSAAAIEDAVRELLATFLERNDCGAPAVQLAIFTATADLTAAKPAAAARRAGWHDTQFLCLAEMPTDDDVPFCLRVLLLVYRGRGASPLKPIYLHGARALRPDLVSG